MAKLLPNPYPEICKKLECRIPPASKYYLFEWDPKAGVYRTTYGRIGGAKAATAAYEPDAAKKLFAQKLKKGYKVVSSTQAAPPAAKAPGAPQDRVAMRFDLLKTPSPEILLGKHGHKTVRFATVEQLGWGPDADGNFARSLSQDLPDFHTWLGRRGSAASFNVREVWERILSGHDDLELEPTEQIEIFQRLLAASDLV